MKVRLLLGACFLVACGARTRPPELDREGENKPVIVPPNEVRAVSVGARHACAVKGDGSTFCWGDGALGQLGTGAKTSSPLPVAVANLKNVQSVAAGGRHTCALDGDGAVFCWGSRAVGQTGDGGSLVGGPSTIDVPTPAVGLSSGITEIAAGDAHTCVLRGGAVLCFGANDFGELGIESLEREPSAVSVHGGGSMAHVAAGSGHSCAIRESGQVACWGSDDFGELGGPSTDVCGSIPCATKPVDVAGVGDALLIAAGASRTCAATNGGMVCWGALVSGVTFEPTPAPGLGTVTAIAIGRAHTCAIASGRVLCYGEGSSGQLGFVPSAACPHGTGSCAPVAGEVLGLPQNARAIAAGGDSTCAVLVDGSLWCWGRNDTGQLGDGSTTDHAAPVKVLL